MSLNSERKVPSAADLVEIGNKITRKNIMSKNIDLEVLFKSVLLFCTLCISMFTYFNTGSFSFKAFLCICVFHENTLGILLKLKPNV